MKYSNPQSLVETDWLDKNLDDPNIKTLDASYFLPGVRRDPKKEFETQHIPGAMFFDIEEIADKNSPQSHMLPDEITFADKVSSLGINNKDKVIVYDSNSGGLAAARCWWMFRVFDHSNVALLNGGFQKWLSENRPITNETTKIFNTVFTCKKNNDLVRDIQEMLKNVQTRDEQVIDARSKDRFDGVAPEPRKGARAGHIPGSFNIPYKSFFNEEQENIVQNATELKKIIKNAGINLSEPIVTSCGSGVSAAMLCLGFFLIGKEDVAVYDGSWSEWGMRSDTPIEK